MLLSVFPGLPGFPGFSSMFGKKKKRLEISAPSNFEHRVHTGFDPREQKFTGLPQQWQSLLADTANRPKPMVDPSCITPIQLAPMKVECGLTGAVRPEQGLNSYYIAVAHTALFHFGDCFALYFCFSFILTHIFTHTLYFNSHCPNCHIWTYYIQ